MFVTLGNVIDPTHKTKRDGQRAEFHVRPRRAREEARSDDHQVLVVGRIRICPKGELEQVQEIVEIAAVRQVLTISYVGG